jgi:hypothetical protein
MRRALLSSLLVAGLTLISCTPQTPGEKAPLTSEERNVIREVIHPNITGGNLTKLSCETDTVTYSDGTTANNQYLAGMLYPQSSFLDGNPIDSIELLAHDHPQNFSKTKIKLNEIEFAIYSSNTSPRVLIFSTTPKDTLAWYGERVFPLSEIPNETIRTLDETSEQILPSCQLPLSKRPGFVPPVIYSQ